MRAIGPTASLRKHEQEMLFVGAKCKAHEKAEVQAIGDEMLKQRKKIKDARGDLEEIEDALVLANALTVAKDYTRDRSLVTLGALMDAIHPGERDRIFRKAPSVLAKLGYDKETTEISGVLAKLQVYPKDDPVRLAYEARLTDQNKEFQSAKDKQEETELELTTFRMSVLRLKMDNDRFREKQYGLLLSHLSKSDTEALLRLRERATKSSDKPSPSPVPS